ncbi:hypothetical protein ADUPG1_011525, partial [Aduncisulcus paluster]
RKVQKSIEYFIDDDAPDDHASPLGPGTDNPRCSVLLPTKKSSKGCIVATVKSGYIVGVSGCSFEVYLDDHGESGYVPHTCVLLMDTEKDTDDFGIDDDDLSDLMVSLSLSLSLMIHDYINTNVTSDVLYSGVRFPDHPVARTLIRHAKIPIAAPSANRFGHISPTTAQHVKDDLEAPCRDLYKTELHIIDGGCTQIGIESTVLAINDNNVTIFRRGGFPVSLVESVLKPLDGVTINVFHPLCFRSSLLSIWWVNFNSSASRKGSQTSVQYTVSHSYDSIFIVDIAGHIASLSTKFKHYIDICPDGDLDMAAQSFFHTLRHIEAELKDGTLDIEAIVICDLTILYYTFPKLDFSHTTSHAVSGVSEES